MASWLAAISNFFIGSAYEWFASHFLRRPKLRAIKEKIDRRETGRIEGEAEFDFLCDEIERSGLTPQEFCIYMESRIEEKRKRQTREDRITGWELAHRKLIQAKESLGPEKFLEWTKLNKQAVIEFLNDSLVPTALQHAVSTIITKASNE